MRHLKLLEKSIDQEVLRALKLLIPPGSFLSFTLNHLKKYTTPPQSEQQREHFCVKAKPEAPITPTKSTGARIVLKLNTTTPSPKPKLANGYVQLPVTTPGNTPIGLVITSIGKNTECIRLAEYHARNVQANPA